MIEKETQRPHTFLRESDEGLSKPNSVSSLFCFGSCGRNPVVGLVGFCKMGMFLTRQVLMSLLFMVFFFLKFIELLGQLTMEMLNQGLGTLSPFLLLGLARFCIQRTPLRQLYISIMATLRLMLLKVLPCRLAGMPSLLYAFHMGSLVLWRMRP